MKNFQSLEKTATQSSNHWKIFAIAAAFVISAVAVAAEPAAQPPKFSGPLKRVGSVEVDAATKTVVATGFVEQVFGLLDYLAVGVNGKRYESLLTLELNPMDLQTALLLCGAKAGEPMSARDSGPPSGSPVKMWVAWKTNGTELVVPAESLIWDHAENKPVPTDWTFTGSVVRDGHFGASDEECFVAVRWDPYAIVNISNGLGKTYGDVYVNTNAVPASNTAVRVFFQAR